jgi:hypothetical protein
MGGNQCVQVDDRAVFPQKRALPAEIAGERNAHHLTFGTNSPPLAVTVTIQGYEINSHAVPLEIRVEGPIC